MPHKTIEAVPIPFARQADKQSQDSEPYQHRHGKPAQLSGVGPPLDVLEEWKSLLLHVSVISLCNLCVLCVSGLERLITTESHQRTPSVHGERFSPTQTARGALSLRASPVVSP